MAFFAHSMLRDLDLSPDGKWVAGVAASATSEVVMACRRVGGTPMPLARVEREKKATAMTVESLAWAGPDHLLFVVGEPLQGYLNHARRNRIFSVDVRGNVVELLAKPPSGSPVYSQGEIVSLLPDDPYHFLLGIRSGYPRDPWVARIDVRSGKRKRVQGSRDGVFNWGADHLGRVRAAWRVQKPAGEELSYSFLARTDVQSELTPVATWSMSKGLSVTLGAFTPDPELIYVVAPGENRRLGVYLFDIAKREFKDERYTDDVFDVGSVVGSPYDGRPLYVLYEGERPVLIVLDDNRKRLQRLLDSALPGRLNYIIDSDRDESVFLVLSYSDVVPPEYYWMVGDELILFFEAYPELKNGRFSPMKPVRYQARDGITVHGYLTRPVDAPEGPLRTIVIPHGGPFARDVWGWNPVVQFFASRGFAVFQPNFRGSQGYGTEFEQLGWGEWGLAMQHDITDGVRWLIETGQADPNRIGIFGASYGGYAALHGLASTPELYKAGASLSGVTDLRLFMKHVAENLYYTDHMKRLVGDRRLDKERLIATSPVHNAHRIRAPVLLGHGTRDRNASVIHTKDMARALRRADVPVEVHLYDDEPHDFLDDRNLAHFFERLAEFFETHL